MYVLPNGTLVPAAAGMSTVNSNRGQPPKNPLAAAAAAQPQAPPPPFPYVYNVMPDGYPLLSLAARQDYMAAHPWPPPQGMEQQQVPVSTYETSSTSSSSKVRSSSQRASKTNKHRQSSVVAPQPQPVSPQTPQFNYSKNTDTGRSHPPMNRPKQSTEQPQPPKPTAKAAQPRTNNSYMPQPPFVGALGSVMMGGDVTQMNMLEQQYRGEPMGELRRPHWPEASEPHPRSAKPAGPRSSKLPEVGDLPSSNNSTANFGAEDSTTYESSPKWPAGRVSSMNSGEVVSSKTNTTGQAKPPPKGPNETAGDASRTTEAPGAGHVGEDDFDVVKLGQEFEQFLKKNRKILFRIFLQMKEDSEAAEHESKNGATSRPTLEEYFRSSSLMKFTGDGGPPSLSGFDRSRNSFMNASSGRPNRSPSLGAAYLREEPGFIAPENNDSATQYCPETASPKRQCSAPALGLNDYAPLVADRSNVSGGLDLKTIHQINEANLALLQQTSKINEQLKEQPTDFLIALQRQLTGGSTKGLESNGTKTSNTNEPSPPDPLTKTNSAPSPSSASESTKLENTVVRTLTLSSGAPSEVDPATGENPGNLSRDVHVVRVMRSPEILVVPKMFTETETEELMRFAANSETLKLYSDQMLPYCYGSGPAPSSTGGDVDSVASTGPSGPFLVLLSPQQPHLSCLVRVAAADALYQFFVGLRQRCAAFCKVSPKSCAYLWIERHYPDEPKTAHAYGALKDGQFSLMITVFLTDGSQLPGKETIGGLDSPQLGFKVNPEAGTGLFGQAKDMAGFDVIPPSLNGGPTPDGGSKNCLYMLRCLFASDPNMCDTQTSSVSSN